MGDTKTPSALPAFSHNWVGGDIHGISALAGTLYGYMPQITGACKALDKQVANIVHDAGWTGDAAGKFTKAWGRDSLAGTAVSTAVGSAGDIVDNLAVTLATIESGLEKAATTASGAGVTIGANGEPPATPPQGSAHNMAVGYGVLYKEAINDAHKARVKAASDLSTLYDQIGPQNGLQPGDYNTLGDYLRALWTVPSQYRKYIESKIEDLKKTVTQARADWKAAQAAARGADGRFGVMPDDVKKALADAKNNLKTAETKLSSASSKEGPLTRLLDTRLADLPKMPTIEGENGWAKFAKFGMDLPVIDIAAAGVGTWLNVAGDKGPWYKNVVPEAGANFGGLALGTEAGTLTTGVLVSAGAASGLAVGAGAVVGGGVAVVAGDFLHNAWNENWGDDIHKHGVVGGIFHGIGDAGAHTGKDIAHMASSLWHSIF